MRNTQLIFEDLWNRANEEGKEVKKCQHVAKDFVDFLGTIKEIIGISVKGKANNFLSFPQNTDHSLGEESFAKEIFEDHILQLQEKAKEKEEEKAKEKEGKEKEEKKKEKKMAKEQSKMDESDRESRDWMK